MSSDHAYQLWERGWEGHETHQRERLAGLSLAEKLRWLEEAHHLVLQLSSVSPKPAERVDDESKPRP